MNIITAMLKTTLRMVRSNHCSRPNWDIFGLISWSELIIGPLLINVFPRIRFSPLAHIASLSYLRIRVLNGRLLCQHILDIQISQLERSGIFVACWLLVCEIGKLKFAPASLETALLLLWCVLCHNISKHFGPAGNLSPGISSSLFSLLGSDGESLLVTYCPQLSGPSWT